MNELDFKEIGKRIKEIRLMHGLTQEYVASKSGINTSHISNIENNRVKISLSTLVKVCNILDTTIDYMLSNEYSSGNSAFDNEILKALECCDDEKKEQILKIIHILARK